MPIETLELRYAGDPEAVIIRVPDHRDPKVLTLIPRDRAAEVAIWAHWHRPDVAAFVPNTIASVPIVPAFVNDSRWIVQCPFCNGAQATSKADPRFFCIDCLNERAGGSWLRVQWPPLPEEIEAVLLRRPERHTRSWDPKETLVDLERQNHEHGVA